MSGLVTVPVSQAGADQRRGRAGRQQPGACYRLWTEKQHAQLPLFAPPEIVAADLSSLALELARWGDPDVQRLRFLDPPPAANLLKARALLARLGALDEKGKLTIHGRAMSELPVHPRLAHMLIRGTQLGLGSLVCNVAALLEERDLLRGENDADVDLHTRWHALKGGRARDRFARDRVLVQAARLREQLRVADERMPEEKLGVLLALAYPERVAKRRGVSEGRYQLVSGTGAVLPKRSLLAREQYLSVGEVDGVGSEVRVYLAAPLSETDLNQAFADRLVTTDEVGWDVRQEAIVARRVTRLGAIELSEVPLTPSKELQRTTMVEGIRTLGLHALPWSKEAISLRNRSEWLRTLEVVGGGWPDLSDRHLMDTLDQWLGPYLCNITRRAHLQQLDLRRILRALFSHEQLRDLDRLAPEYLAVPTGTRVALDYNSRAQPVLAVRLQEMFGETETPVVAGGKVKVLLHLLSPAHRPLAVTQDLPSFWKNAYPEVRKNMRGRYPKHSWPEDPLHARPAKRGRRR
jgi:ATP-dependent helicase HrpB